MFKLRFRQRLAAGEEFILKSLMGGVLGLAVGLLIVCFHSLINWAIDTAGQPSDWAIWQVALFPMLGALVTTLVFRRYQHRRDLGAKHVVDVLHRSPKHWPTTNAAIQFLLTPLLLASGQSGGREGPSVHLGATLGAMITERLRLPRNNLRVFVGAGAAAAIGGTFLTPLAGVAFAMEVIVMEYTVVGFLPIIMAAVAASALVSLIMGEPLVPLPTFDQISDPNWLWVILIGVACGVLASLFNRSTRWAAQHMPKFPILMAGALCAAVGLVIPAALGDGHQLWSQLANNELSVPFILGLIVAKLVITTVVVGWGMPLGLISPLLLLGAFAGSTVSLIVTGGWSPLYAMIGMTSMMGAALMAPLAALIFVIELSGQTSLMMPAMLALTLAIMTHRLCGQGALFVDQLSDQGVLIDPNRSNHPLHHLGVQAAMNTQFVVVPKKFSSLPRQADFVMWRSGPKQMQGLPWLDFVRATSEFSEGDLLTSLEAPMLGRITDTETLAEVVSQCREREQQGCYVMVGRRIRGLIIEKQLREQFL